MRHQAPFFESMTRSGTEPQSPGPFAKQYTYIYIYIYICVCVCVCVFVFVCEKLICHLPKTQTISVQAFDQNYR